MSLLSLFPTQDPATLPLVGGWSEPVRRLALKGQWVDIRIVRSAKRRTLTLSFDDKGLKAQAPVKISEDRILAFVREKSDWVLSHMVKHEERQRILSAPPQLWVLGQVFSFQTINPALADHPKESGLDIMRCVYWHSPHEDAKESARLALMALAEKEIGRRLPPWAGKMGLALPRWQMSRAETRWGSCSLETGLRFSWKLGAVFPMLLDYVIVHELSHLRHMNHSSAFWQEVGKYYPSWGTARKALRDFEIKLAGW